MLCCVVTLAEAAAHQSISPSWQTTPSSLRVRQLLHDAPHHTAAAALLCPVQSGSTASAPSGHPESSSEVRQQPEWAETTAALPRPAGMTRRPAATVRTCTLSWQQECLLLPTVPSEWLLWMLTPCRPPSGGELPLCLCALRHSSCSAVQKLGAFWVPALVVCMLWHWAKCNRLEGVQQIRCTSSGQMQLNPSWHASLWQLTHTT